MRRVTPRVAHVSSNTSCAGAWLQIREGSDFYTAYIVGITFLQIDGMSKSWQLQLRYSTFKKLYDAIYSAARKRKITITNEFPAASMYHGVFRSDEHVRNERQKKFNLWLNEVNLCPTMMTVLSSSQALYDFLEIKSHCDFPVPETK